MEAQKNRTHVDPEVTLQFLKSAIFYFLTDKENSQGHLQAIESILEFTDAEKQKISAARTPKWGVRSSLPIAYTYYYHLDCTRKLASRCLRFWFVLKFSA